MLFILYLHAEGLISDAQFVHVTREHFSKRPKLGTLAIENGMLDVKEVMSIFRAQADELDTPFGQLAIRLGMLTQDDLARLLLKQSDARPSPAQIAVACGYVTQEDVDAHQLRFHNRMSEPASSSSTG
ncbi:MAG: hypothetical protein AAF802_07385 [Planctomycetota bacterium]